MSKGESLSAADILSRGRSELDATITRPGPIACCGISGDSARRPNGAVLGASFGNVVV
ncbi:MAG: hypothetical protein NVV68_13765 [Dokdonella sp.]|nr:hypothetical protein [Dokdonella sp.]